MRLQSLSWAWLGRLDSNQGMAESKSAALPLGYAPPAREGRGRLSRSGRTIVRRPAHRNTLEGGRCAQIGEIGVGSAHEHADALAGLRAIGAARQGRIGCGAAGLGDGGKI